MNFPLGNAFFNNIKKDIDKISYVSYILELTEQVAKQHYNERLYALVISAILTFEGFLSNPCLSTYSK